MASRMTAGFTMSERYVHRSTSAVGSDIPGTPICLWATQEPSLRATTPQSHARVGAAPSITYPIPRARSGMPYGTAPTAWPGQPEDRTTAKSDREAPPEQTDQPLVLVVEDEESIAETLALIVEDVGYTPIIARNGREALALALRYHPRLIITDLMMPYLGGADFIAAARTDATTEGYPFPPVIVITAASRARAEEAGADVVITKPFDVLKVEAAILRLVEGQPN